MDRIADEVGARIYAAAGKNPARPPAGGCVALALAIRGEDAIYLQPWAVSEASLSTMLGVRRIVLRRGLPRARVNFLVGQMLARLTIEDECWFVGSSPDVQARITQRIGAWLAVPTPALARLPRNSTEDVGALADSFRVSWSCAAMRVAEAGGGDVAVVTPRTVYQRGSGILARLPGAEVRSLAAKRSAKGLRRVVLHDEPGRVALLARSA